MRCSICDSTRMVGKDNLCKKCRSSIIRARNTPSTDDAFEKIEAEARYDILFGIDTSKADSFAEREE